MAGRVWVPGYRKEDGTMVAGYWREEHRTARAPRLKGSRTFRSITFRKAAR